MPTLSGLLQHIDGSAVTEPVSVWANTEGQIVRNDTGAVLLSGEVRTIPVNGSFSIVLPNSSDSNNTPTNYTYSVRLPDGSIHSFSLTHDTNLKDIVPVAPSSGDAPQYVTLNGLNAALTSNAGFDVILIVGQSNAVGTNSDYDQRTDPPDSRVWAFEGAGTYANKITQAVEPMSHQVGPSGVGPGLPFGRWYASMIPGNRRVLLVPSGVGGTAITTTSGDTWNPRVRGSLYDKAVAQAQTAMAAAGANARLVAILWIQGEQDFAISATGSAYQTAQDALIGGLRRDLGVPNLPFIIGAMAPPSYRSSAIGVVQSTTPSRVRYTAYVEPAVGYARNDSPVHYTAAGQRVMGLLMANVLPTAVANISPAAAPLPGANINNASPLMISHAAIGDYIPAVQVTAQVGDTLVCMAGTNNDVAVVSAPTGGTGLIWTLRAQTPSAPNIACTEFMWTATVTAALNNVTLTCAQQNAQGVWMDVQVWRGVNGFGAIIHPAVTANSGATATITTTAANSSMAIGITDWNELDGTTRTWNTSAGPLTETFYLRPHPLFTCYVAAIQNTGVAGVKTIGITSPTVQQASILAIELLAG